MRKVIRFDLTVSCGSSSFRDHSLLSVGAKPVLFIGSHHDGSISFQVPE